MIDFGDEVFVAGENHDDQQRTGEREINKCQDAENGVGFADREGVQREVAQFQVADLQLDVLRRRVTRAGERITLTNKEFALLHLLISREAEVLSRAQIASQVWHMNFDSDTNVVDVAIRRLRAKIDDKFTTKLIQTVRGMGYMLDEPD